MHRRSALKLISAGGVALYLAPRYEFSAWASSNAKIDLISPIDRSLPQIAPAQFFSDYPDKAHSVLWNKAAFVSEHTAPKIEKTVPLVVVGGGMAGLSCAYLLRKHKPILLEQAPRFGGNAKGQSWNGIDYAIGAAYFIEPEVGSELDRFVKELGIDKLWHIKREGDPVALRGKVLDSYWEGELPGVGKLEMQQIGKLASYLAKVNEGEEIAYPDIPVSDAEGRAYINQLDRETFRAHLEKVCGATLSGSLESAIEHYCWSSLGAASSEISAAAGLNFLAAEFGAIAVLPGGNAAFAERLLARLAPELPSDHLRADALVYDLSVTDAGVQISYQDRDGGLHALMAKTAVLACPKFVVSKILSGIEPERLEVIRKLKYRSYLVANLCLKDKAKAPFYDLYLLGEGKTNAADIRSASNAQQITDVIYADYARALDGYSVLTLYRAFPYDGARAEMLSPDSYQRFRAEFERQISESILPLLKLKKDQIIDLRIARWGHPLPVASPGLIADGSVDLLRKPFKQRVFFVEQDNWALPALETAVMEAFTFVPQIEKVIS